MKVTSIALVMACGRAGCGNGSPRGDQAEEQFRALLEVNDGVIYDRDDPESSGARNARQNIRRTGIERGPTVLIGRNFPNMQSCLQKCNAMDFPAVIFRIMAYADAVLQ